MLEKSKSFAQASGDMLVEMHNAGVSRGGRWLVRGVDLSVRRGEIVTLIGPNGSGKSTTAKTAIGIIQPSEGHVHRAGTLRVGYVPQKVALDWTLPLSVERLMTLTAPAGRQEISVALEAAGVGHLAERQVAALSGGEFQRALLARAMLRKPDLLVLDEPVQGVDFTGEVALYELIRDIRDRTGCGILMISHDLHIVMADTDTVICLNGHVCCRGEPQSVMDSPEYRKLFGTRAAEALALYRHHHDHTHLADGRVRHADGTITEHCHKDNGHHHHDHVGTEAPAKGGSDAR
ncbi:metal ABC transporter ATP-binding protein [Nitratireductor rhodophyticola]|uniref:metal ABC transporter ATP-binding protein n=1 Tax=Nitratireductor rhodophyticola TaxID=2854036 RepID=UPI002AC93E27|nr:metal ABC transporter ATP-binding protein [Nitratireductor rhodophyticola]WPZ14950.1 metal ABC transporter ATP-binding protein [Nitratireductor rhodophyticola]